MDNPNQFGIAEVDDDGTFQRLVEKPEDPPSNLVMTGFYTFSWAIFPACHLAQPSNRGE